MATTRSIPNRLEYPGFGKSIMVDATRGAVRIRKWPGKRGQPKSATVRLINSRFAQAQKLAKECDASMIVAAMEQTKGSGLYPRDLLTKYILNCPLEFVLPDGTVIAKERPEVRPVAFQGARLQKTVGQTIGAGMTVVATWQNPIIDTAAIFSFGAPTRLTVPLGVTRMQFSAGLAVASATNSPIGMAIRKNGTENVANCFTGTALGPSGSLATGPLNVVAGDFFEVLWGMNTTHTSFTTPNVYFACQILEGA